MFSNGNVFLSDHNSGVMDWVGELSLEHNSLESSLHQLWESHTQDVIELLFVFLEKTETHHTTDQGITYNEHINIYCSMYGKCKFLPSKILLGSFSSKVKSCLAAFLNNNKYLKFLQILKYIKELAIYWKEPYLILASTSCTLHTSLLFFNP